MTGFLVGLSAVAAAVAVLLIRRSAPARLAALAASPARRPAAAGVARSGRHRGTVVALLAVLAGASIAGFAGAFTGAVAGAAVLAIRRRPPASVVDVGELCLAVDLAAGCLAAGAALPDALMAASASATEPLRGRFDEIVGAIRAGSPPDEVWQPWLDDPHLAALARTAVRTTQTGAAAADELRRAAARLRARRRALVQRRVRQTSVWVVVPLGLCFLPAFVLVAVVPLVVGLVPSWH